MKSGKCMELVLYLMYQTGCVHRPGSEVPKKHHTNTTLANQSEVWECYVSLSLSDCKYSNQPQKGYNAHSCPESLNIVKWLQGRKKRYSAAYSRSHANPTHTLHTCFLTIAITLAISIIAITTLNPRISSPAVLFFPRRVCLVGAGCHR